MKGGMDSVLCNKKFAAIEELAKKGHSVFLLCRLSQVSRSGDYMWMKRQQFTSSKQLEDEQTKMKIMECCNEVRGIYGYRRVKVWIEKKYGQFLNHKRIQRLMNEMGIQAVIRKKKPFYGKKEAYVISSKLLNRDFYAAKPNEKWVTDITYLIFN